APGLRLPAGQRPPLSCRTSPPQGGRLAAATLSPFVDIAGRAAAHELPISPLEGEIAGRPEGGCPAGLTNCPTSSRQAFPPCRDCPCR
ncbi:MAG: hypothetical protein EOR45_32520, partial [Mesorhizobium sp.]